MKCPSFKCVNLFVQLLHFKSYPPPPSLDGEGEGGIKIFSQPFECCIFWTGVLRYRVNIRPQGIYPVAFPGGIELTHKPLAFLCPAPALFSYSFRKLILFIFFFLLVRKEQPRVIARPFSLWPLLTLQLQLFSCPVSRSSSIHSVPSASNTPPSFLCG